MVRSRQWWYATGTSGATRVSDWTVAAGLPEGTIQRIIGTVSYWTDDTGLGGSLTLAFGYVLNVGAVAEVPLSSGVEPEGVIMRRFMWNPTNAAGTQVGSPRPLERWDIESGRIISTGEDLHFAVSTASPGVAWWWAVEMRVLMLLPESVS